MLSCYQKFSPNPGKNLVQDLQVTYSEISFARIMQVLHIFYLAILP